MGYAILCLFRLSGPSSDRQVNRQLVSTRWAKQTTRDRATRSASTTGFLNGGIWKDGFALQAHKPPGLMTVRGQDVIDEAAMSAEIILWDIAGLLRRSCPRGDSCHGSPFRCGRATGAGLSITHVSPPSMAGSEERVKGLTIKTDAGRKIRWECPACRHRKFGIGGRISPCRHPSPVNRPSRFSCSP